jgi:hypothetical protein
MDSKFFLETEFIPSKDCKIVDECELDESYDSFCKYVGFIQKLNNDSKLYNSLSHYDRQQIWQDLSRFEYPETLIRKMTIEQESEEILNKTAQHRFHQLIYTEQAKIGILEMLLLLTKNKTKRKDINQKVTDIMLNIAFLNQELKRDPTIFYPTDLAFPQEYSWKHLYYERRGINEQLNILFDGILFQDSWSRLTQKFKKTEQYHKVESFHQKVKDFRNRRI